MKRTLIFLAAILLMGFSILLIIEGSQKSPSTRSTLDFPEQVQLSSGKTYQIPPYVIIVTQPSILLMGAISHVNVSIHPRGTETASTNSLLKDDFQVFVESKLEITNAQIAPDGLIHAALKADQDTNFTWNIMTDQSSRLTGTLWIYLAVQPNSSSTTTEEQPLFAIPMNIHVTTVLGLPADLAIVIGIFGCLVAITLLIVALRLLFFKRKTKKSK